MPRHALPTTRSRSSTRRRFLAAASTTVAAGLAGARAHTQAPADPPVSKGALACAEALTGVAFSDAEHELMLRAVNANREHFEAIRRVPLGPEIEPAISFRLPAAAVAGRPRATPGRLTTPPSAAPPRSLLPDDLAFASAVELASLLRARRVSSVDLTRMYLDRLERYDPILHCVITLTKEAALEQAAQADREIAAGQYRGPLHGLPYGLKDLVATKGIRTTWGATPYEHQVLDYDATVYERLRAAGAVLVAKLTSGELAVGDLWFGGRTRNPWNPARGSGGSSAGPGAATAAGLVAFAIGTETNGSIISPSSTCGVTGLRPTYGRVSRHGVMALRWTMDKVGVLARTAEDCAIVLDAVHGPDGRDETVADVGFDWAPVPYLAGIRVGVVERELAGPDPEAPEESRARHAERSAIVRTALAVLEEAGATLTPISLPDLPARAMYAVCNAEAGAAFDDLVRSGAVGELAEKGPNGRANQLRWARFVPAVEYLRAQRVRTVLLREIDAGFGGIDVFVAPTDSASVTMTNFTGHPAVTVNAGFARGLPVGLMLTGRHYDEAQLLRVAHAYQQRTDWHRQRPAL